jgi:hypothetical protein
MTNDFFSREAWRAVLVQDVRGPAGPTAKGPSPHPWNARPGGRPYGALPASGTHEAGG